ncbi:hypothetical protein GCM10007384_13510 [Aquimarina muelleri]|uniref:Methionyl-tRNA formyltransferase n=1 Tax=Aquimarina muelleri TaxID=279356 RepID=A0A918N2L4_9FLAO|nr:hypothetical protein GCM10007384_13510 [Aquimarina muelleri]
MSKHNYLDAVCVQKYNTSVPNQDFWVQSIKHEGFETYTIDSNSIKNKFKTWLEDRSPDLVIVYGFSLKIPEEILSIPKYGFLNIHFGKLPENRGPDPLFWSIKNGEKETAITIHQMDKDWDTGKILLEEPIPIIQGETGGMINSKMNFILVQLIEKTLSLIQEPVNYRVQPTKNRYNKRPSDIETTINWEEQTADEIENLINACNPKYGGATTYYQGSPIKIIEVSPVDGQLPLLGKTAGEIIHAHPQEGLYVCCKYGKLLKINIVSSDAGILTGNKYIHLGLRQGHLLTTTLTETKKISVLT